MPINNSYDEAAIVEAIATALDNFYTNLIKKVDSLNVKTVMKRKNPYLFRAKAMNGAAQIIDAILAAFVSSSEETIFGNVFFEPIATAAAQGQKALAEGVDIMVERDNTIYAIAVKSGTSVFNADSRKKQEQNFMAASKLAQQAKKRFVPIVGYGYGKKKVSNRGLPKFYMELAGKDFWTELTGDEEFYIKLIRFMDKLPEKYVEEFDASYQKAANRLVREFTQEFCFEDGSIEALKNAVHNAILLECKLPHQESGLDKSCLSSQNDICFSNSNPQEISKIIYNGIVEFAINEYEIDYNALEREQRKAILSRIRYNPEASEDTKLKYGFYGEVLLDLILRVFLNTSVLAARGYFYSPIENSEAKGFDAFHLMEREGNIDLWFGEAKFYVQYKSAITPVMEKLSTSLSDGYVNRNLLAIIDERTHISTHNAQLENLLNSWEENPDINLSEEIKNRGIRLIYPIFIAYQKNITDQYHQSIKKCIDHIASEYMRLNIVIPASFDYRLFFIFLPLSEVKQIKENVIKWIDSREPLI